jgi:dTDP-4-dehydrorhamnose reductase
MTTVAVIGANGYVGKTLYDALVQLPQYVVTAVTRDNYAEMQKKSFDIVINSAMPSARFKAKNDPVWDFAETVSKTADILYGWKYTKFVQISTVSARCQLDTVYGRHKAAAEKLCDFGDNLIVRLGAMYSNDLSKGVLVDMMEGKKVFVDGDSRYCFASRDFVASWIATHLDRISIVEIGGIEAVSLRDIARHLGKTIEFEGALDHQEIENPDKDMQQARDVLDFLDGWKR